MRLKMADFGGNFGAVVKDAKMGPQINAALWGLVPKMYIFRDPKFRPFSWTHVHIFFKN